MSRTCVPARPCLTTRRCCRCGYDGPETQDTVSAFICPCCGEDLYARPPMSYLEMEGFVPTGVFVQPSLFDRVRTRAKRFREAIIRRMLLRRRY